MITDRTIFTTITIFEPFPIRPAPSNPAPTSTAPHPVLQSCSQSLHVLRAKGEDVQLLASVYLSFIK
ncbi:hypothetical protein E2C01_098272 [Portunus trituberculatus]|uniref:Uncharacterized protein n=1 Tax=Portunus trituberculatus TaxID=210409 RepID=A0A5B7K791_PORTR|nr:hypothetical protein [Portunus trituberculatus]